MSPEELDELTLAGMRLDPECPYPADIPDDIVKATYAFQQRRVLAAYHYLCAQAGLDVGEQ